jgi:hypothetical protein
MVARMAVERVESLVALKVPVGVVLMAIGREICSAKKQ